MLTRRSLRDSVLGVLMFAGVIGAGIGLAVALLHEAVVRVQSAAFSVAHGQELGDAALADPWRTLLVPAIGGLLLGLLVKLVRRWRSNDIVDPIEANALYGGKMSLIDSLRLTLATLLSNGSGASVGMEAAYTQAGAGIASALGQRLRLRRADLRTLVGCGAAAAIAAGAVVHTASPVEAVEDEGAAWRLLTPRGSVRAPRVIVATNAYTSAVWPEVRGELVHLPYFNLATKPLDEDLRRSILPERQGVWDTREVLSSFRFDQQGRLVFGSVGALRGSGLAIHRDWGRRALAKLFPQLRGVEFECEWYGQIGMTDNSLPRFHRLGRNVVSFSGYNGRGIAPGTVFGRCLAQLMLGAIGENDLPLPITAPEPARHRAAKEAYYEAGAQIVHFTGARF